MIGINNNLEVVLRTNCDEALRSLFADRFHDGSIRSTSCIRALSMPHESVSGLLKITTPVTNGLSPI